MKKWEWEFHGQKKTRYLAFQSNSRATQKPGMKRRLIPKAASCRHLKLEVPRTCRHSSVLFTELSPVRWVSSAAWQLMSSVEAGKGCSALVTVRIKKEDTFVTLYQQTFGLCITPLSYGIAKLTLRCSYICKITFMFKVAQSPANRVRCFRNKPGLYRGGYNYLKAFLSFFRCFWEEKMSVCDVLISLSHEAIESARKNLATLCSCRGLNKFHQNKL